MATKYKLPDFDNYQPDKVKKITEKIDKELENVLFSFSKTKLKRSIKKLKTNEELMRSEYKILFYHLSSLRKNKEIYNRLIKKSMRYFNKPGNYLYHYKALLSSYYNNNKNKIFQLLKLISNNNKKWKKDMLYIKKLIDKVNTSHDFYKIVLQELNKCESEDDLESLKRKLQMKNNNLFLKQVFYSYIMDNLSTNPDNSNELIINIVENNLPWEKKKKIYEKWLLLHKNFDFDTLTTLSIKWFELIGEQMGDPYGLNSASWADLSNTAKDIFKNWYAFNKISYFFNEISGDTRRLQFWKKYSHHFYRIEYLYDLIIIMESRQHLFVEFSNKASGRFYLYDLEDEVTIEKIMEFKKNRSKSFMLSFIKGGYDYYNKRKYKSKLALKHYYHSWEEDFARELFKYGYEPR